MLSDKGIYLFHGDCVGTDSWLLRLSSCNAKVDLVLADPPYGTTQCKWDSVIPFVPLWEGLNSLIDNNVPVCIFGMEPFSSALRMSNIKNFKYDWIWQKSQATGFLNAKKTTAAGD